MSQAKRVCVIGAGPGGMSALYHFNRLKAQGKEIPEIVCYDKQSDWGGLWKYSWETGTDIYGEPVHGSMYQGLWSNGPKEGAEYPDYTYDEHFGKAIPSCPPREVLYDYLKGRWTKNNLRHWIRFKHVVRHVTYNDTTDDFSVVVKNLAKDQVLPPERFDHVIVASGHFSVPNMPYFPGIEKFPGRVIHSHDFKNGSQFKCKRVLVVGSSLSAEDIALQCLKYGAEKIVCTWRSKPMGFKWPPQITEKPLLTNVEGNIVHFKDGTIAEVDDIILCTGYHYSFPFLEERLRLKTPNVLYPAGLYKGILWINGGNNKVLYVGALNEYYTFNMLDAQAHWAVNCISGEIKLPDKQVMESESQKWIGRKSIAKGWKKAGISEVIDGSRELPPEDPFEDLHCRELAALRQMAELKGPHDQIDFQTAYVTDVTMESKYPYNLDSSEFLHAWVNSKMDDILTYRNRSYKSQFTGTISPLFHTPFMKEFDDSMEHFLNTEY